MFSRKVGVPVIMYHSVAPMNDGWIWKHLGTSPGIFAKQIEMLAKKNFKSIWLRELYDHMRYNKNLPSNSIALTFDDGYLDNWTYAYPILKKYNMKGTVFVNPEFVDPFEGCRPNLEDVWESKYSKEDMDSRGFLSWQEMRAMEEAGIIDIQSHSMSHTWYFKSDDIIDFHHPGNNDYPWLFWNARPERKCYYLSENQERFVPYGIPIYKHGRSLGIRRYFEDRGLKDHLVGYVRKQGDEFFKKDSWRKILFQQVEYYRSKSSIDDRYETDRELEERYRYELIDSKEIIENKLNKKVQFLCWAGGAVNEKAMTIANEAGYLSSTLFFNDGSRKNIFNQAPSEINRTGCVCAFTWRRRRIYTSAHYFLAHIRYFQGRKFARWIMRTLKLIQIVNSYIRNTAEKES